MLKCSQHRVFPFSCWPREGFRKEQRIQTSQGGFYSESLALQIVHDEEFLHTKINIKDVYLDYGATEDIPEDACCFSCSGGITMDEDLTALTWKLVAKFLKVTY